MTDATVPTTPTLAVRAGAAFAAYQNGDTGRMAELIELLTPILWHAARAQGVDRAQGEDIIQTAWLRLVEAAPRIEEPVTVMKWLMTTVRRECWRQTARADRVDVGLEFDDHDDTQAAPGVDTAVVQRADAEVLWRHVRTLPDRCRSLLRVIAFADKPDYAMVAAALGMPVGSIGPTRGRCLAKLRVALTADPGWSAG